MFNYEKIIFNFNYRTIVSCSNTNDLQKSIDKQKIEQTKSNEKSKEYS